MSQIRINILTYWIFRNEKLVCGDNSIGFNFSVLTCMACKAFFRRNAVKLGKYNYSCPNDGDCPITHFYRRLCNCCRLAKCFRVGMRKELILSEEQKVARRKSALSNRSRKKIIVKKATTQLVHVSHLVRLKTNQIVYLSKEDQSLLHNIFNLYESTCLAAESSQYQTFPLIVHKNLSTYLNEYSLSHRNLIEFVRNIPEFTCLSIHDRICLIRSQFGLINNINEAIIHPGVTTALVVSMCNVFGVYLANRLLQAIERIQMFTYDVVLLKLLLIIITFSSGNHRSRNDTDMNQICTNTLLIFSVQNRYVELLWKYILSKSSNEMNAVKFFNKLIQFLMYLLNVHFLLDGYMNSQAQEIEEMEPLMQSMWPKPSKSEL